ncbi:hypothetical protein [uncultured Psychrobacter sp.]|uniref:hypothetical protein n=1 Tax=uncultured Psychrobacter sp. TaxID=259303 RepID=UPI003458DF1E
MSKKKWLTLGIVGSALLLIPRRSSQQTTPNTKDWSKTDNAQQIDIKDEKVNK